MEPDGSAEPRWAARLYDACATELILYGRALGLSHGEAEDVLHDAFKALLLLAEPPREPRFYLVRTFRNRTLNHRRGLWRRLTRELESFRWFETQEGVSTLEADAVAALSRLPTEQREAIVLKIWHEMTFDEIGDLTGTSPNTAAGRYRYGMQKLRSALDHHHRHETAHEPGSPEESGKPPAWLPPTPALPES